MSLTRPLKNEARKYKGLFSFLDKYMWFNSRNILTKLVKCVAYFSIFVTRYLNLILSMIKKIELQKFKRYNLKNIDLIPSRLSLLVGGNNSGKSTILHALAIWEYCKTVLIYEKNSRAILAGFRGDGYGISIDDFTPINIPSLKYLWTNLKPTGGYSLSIKCYWDIPDGPERFLKIGLALTQERLYIKNLESNIQEGDFVPKIAYLPPFAGITDKEQWYSPAYRNKLIGQGLAGSVLRNTIMDLYHQNIKIRAEKKENRARIPKAGLAELREDDSFEILNKVLFSIFKGVLYPKFFNPDFHTNIKVDFVKGEFINNRSSPFSAYSKRDIMVEGSGFLQWLSVYTFAINPNVDILLLDEPDAHLHNSLQTELIKKLQEISQKLNKQVLIATHSCEVIKSVSPEIVLSVDNNNIRYLKQESDKVKVLSGLGTEYFPKIDLVQRYRRILFVENESDANILKKMCEKTRPWPNNLVIWAFANNHRERKQLFLHLKDEINGLKCISLEDRDNELYENTHQSLMDRTYSSDLVEGDNEFRYRRWRRWEMENYLLSPSAIARKAKCSEESVRQFLIDNHSCIVHGDYLQSEKIPSIAPLFEEGKPIIENICNHFNIKKYQIAEEMLPEEIFEDVNTLINEIIIFCQ